MGSRLSTIGHNDCPGPSVDVELFRTIRPKWVEYFVSRLNENILSDLDIANHDEKVQWRYYFKAFSEIKTFAERDAEVKKRLTWHPATVGFMMQIELPVEEEEEPPAGPADDFTEDEASDISESDYESDEEGGRREKQSSVAADSADGDGNTEEESSSPDDNASSSTPFVPPKHWDPNMISPIFYGYGSMTIKEYRETIDDTQAQTEKSERRAVEKAMASRHAALEEFEANVKAKEAIRIKKLQEITDAYEAERQRREDDLARNKKNLPEMGFTMYKSQWNAEYNAAEKAFDTEVMALRRVHLAKTQEDQAILRAKKEDVESFKDAENQELPAAERLEEISKAEMALWIDEVESRALALEEARQEYQKLRIEFSKIQNNKRKALEMKSALNITETKVRTMQRRLEEGLNNLSDAETLLDRSVRIKEQQDKLLPLFQIVSQLDRGAKECRLDLMLACIVILCSGTYDQKITQVIQAYDADRTGVFGFKFLTRIQMVFHEALYRLKYLPFPPIESEVKYFTERSLMERGCADASKVKLNQYELKQFVASCVGRNQTLCSLLGIAPKVPYGTYQRNKMSELALSERGLISKSTLLYRYHYNMTRFRPLLDPEHVSYIHDLSLSMGANDPLKSDYTRFTKKSKKASDSAVIPLDTGHLTNLKFYSDTIRNDAALVIQTTARAYVQRRQAEFQAKRQAFTQAKLLAMQEMKAKVLQEFKKRESLEGPPKMKWDAQVRMRQAKLRQAGTNLSRSDVVMVMMEEAIVRSREEIETRFRKLEKEQGIDPEEEPSEEVEPEPDDATQGMFSVFGMVRKKANTDVMKEGEEGGEIGTPRADDDEDDTNTNGAVNNRTDTEVERDAKEAEKSQLMVLGKYKHDPTAAGETFNETLFRMTMASPDTTTQHLWLRLKAIDKNLTDVKLREFLSENPTKRLLMLYLRGLTAQQLEVELREHFKIARHWDSIAETLKAIETSDLENGWHQDFLNRYKDMSEGGLRSLVLEDVEKGVGEVEAMVDKRFNGAEGRIPEVDIIRAELDRIVAHHERFKGSSGDLLRNIQQLKAKYRKVMLSVGEMQRREFNVRSVYNKRVGIAQARVPVTGQHRHNWMKRVNVALRRHVETLADAELKFGEIRCVCKEFLEYATHDAMVIIQEHFQPKEFRSTPILSERPVRGRPSVCGRGVDGFEYIYENHNIIYKVCLDYDGAFNGSDEFAAKCGGFDRLGSVEYFKCHTNKLNIPIVATIDYFGFRVTAVSKLPTETVMFTDEGEVKRVKEEMYHGMREGGDRFVNRSKTLQSLLRQTADKLNLDEHGAKGIQDMAGSSTFCSSEIKVFKGTDDEFYLKDFWRAFPAEAPEETPHFQETPRGQCVFWRQLRPEYVRRYEERLSPDALCAAAYSQPDEENQYRKVKEATAHLIKNIIPPYAETLCEREYTQTIEDGLGIDLTKELHDQGIGVRHMGYIRGLLWRELPGTFNIFFNEKFIRTSVDMRGEVSHGMKIRLAGVMYTVTETEKRKVTHNRIPIEKLYTGLSLRNQTATGGRLESERNSEAVRSVILAEMTARTMKNILRMYLREYVKVEHGISTDVKRSLLCKMLNVVTGSDEESNELLMNAVYEGIRSRFGLTSILPSERDTLQRSIIPCGPYIIRRLQKMTGAQLSANCITEFHEHPVAFNFVPMDILSIDPIVRHNMPALAFADAMLASMYAAEGEKRTYPAQVLKDKPVLFYLLSERKGTRTAENKGTLGPSFDGKYSPGCEFEEAGPIAQDKFIRAIYFTPESKSRVETKYHPSAVPKTSASHFSVEVFAMCTGGDMYNRVVCMNGRYGISITREGYWAFIMREGGLHEVSIKVCPVEKNKWTHVVGTYDGTNLRVYIDSWLVVCVEVAGPLRERRDEYYEEYRKKRKELKNLETAERESIKGTAKQQSDDFFLTKDGIQTMKQAARELLQSTEFQAEAIGEQLGTREAAANAKKTEALRRVKHKYATDVYVTAVQQCTERFKELYDDLEVKQKREEEESDRNSRKPMRIGASVTTLASKHGKSYFMGRISCLSVYDTCLHLDRIRAHFVAAQKDAAKDAPRLHAVAARLYEQALLFAGDDPMLLRNYAKSLCDYLRIENTSTTEFAILRGMNKIRDSISDFKNRRLPLGIAEILRAIPVEYRFADLICQGFLAIQETDKHFFARSEGLTRKDIVMFPKQFGLDIPDSPEVYVHAAAAIYKEVTKDFECAEVYGDVNMAWISELKSSHLTVALVSQLAEDSDSRSMKISELYHANPQNIPSLQDSDVKVMAANMRLLVVVDLSRCTQITDASVSALSTLKSIRALTLDGCTLISDDGLEELKNARESLEVLSLASIATITDEGLGYVGQYCRLLTLINVNNCAQVSSVGLYRVAKGCKKLVTMLASATLIDDDGIAKVSACLSKKYFDKMDISFCRDITDHGIVDQCPNMSSLNICGLSSVTDIGTTAICANCWKMTHLNFEDVYLLADCSFFFDREADGRAAADENMLKSLHTLNLKDCVHISDHAIVGLQKRCGKIETLNVQGCHKLTDDALEAMYECVNDDSTNNMFPMCDSFRTLVFASCTNFTANGLATLFPRCGVLESLDLSGITAVTDSLIEDLCRSCPTVQTLAVRRCVALTDSAMCTIASELWLEHLDISYCSKLTDCSIEVLSMACNGMVALTARRVRRLTNKSINMLLRNCKLIKRVDVRECESINCAALDEFAKGYPGVHILHD